MAYGDCYGVNGYYKEDYSGQRPDATEFGPAFSNANAVVKITSIEEAAQQVIELNRASNLGADVTIQLGKTVEKLKEAWQGSDAVVHINNLMEIKDWCAALSSTALEVSTAAHAEIHRMIDKQRANGGNPMEMPSIVYTSYADYLKMNERAVDNGNVFVDTTAARVESSSLKQSKELFAQFVDKYFQVYGYMIDIWQSGGARNHIEDEVNKFKANLERYQQQFATAISSLDQAIANWEA